LLKQIAIKLFNMNIMLYNIQMALCLISFKMDRMWPLKK
jgi:hypothetical protein